MKTIKLFDKKFKANNNKTIENDDHTLTNNGKTTETGTGGLKTKRTATKNTEAKRSKAKSKRIRKKNTRKKKSPLKKKLLILSTGIIGLFFIFGTIVSPYGEKNFPNVHRFLTNISSSIFSSGNKLDGIFTTPVKRGELTIKISEIGELAAQNQATVSAINDKQILYMAPEGSWVEKGDTVVVLESEKYKIYSQEASSSVKVAQAEYQRALNELEAQQAKEEAAKKEYESLPELAKKGYIVESEVEQARLAYLEMKAKSKSLESVVNGKKAEVEKARGNLRNQLRRVTESAMLAPREGIVVYANVGSGEQIRKVQVGMVPFEGMDLMYIPDISSMLAKSEINEVDLDKVKIGQPVEIRLDAFPDAVFTGTVERIGTLAHHKINPATGKSTSAKVFDLVVKVNESDKRLKPGLSATVDIILDKLEDVVYIPIESVFTMENNRNYVYLKNSDSVEKRLVEIGQHNNLYAVVENGLSENDIVLLSEPY